MNELKSKAQITHCRTRISKLLITKFRKFVLYCLINSLFMIACASQVQAQTIPAAGKKFHLALSSQGTNLKYQFLITAQQSTQVAIHTTGGTVVNLTVPANDVVTYTLNAADVANMPSYNAGVFIGGASVYIEATNLVCVYVRTADGANSDASIVFPKEFYSTNYDFVSRPADFNPSVLVNLDQSTTIAPLNGGFTATIPPRNSFSYLPGSIAGVRANADFPVAAFVLGKGLAVDGVTKSDYYHQILPVSESGKSYFIPVTLQGITSACFTATQVNTVVKDHTGATIATLANVGDYKCISVKADANGAYIDADKPLAVGTYMLSKDAPGATGYNPAFAWCPSTEQLTTDVLLGVGTPGTIAAEHVLIVTRSWAKKMTYLSFKGESRNFLTNPVWVDHPSGWSYCNYPITLGTGSYHFSNYAGMIVYAYSGASGDANFYLAGVGHKGALQEPPPTELPDNIKDAKCSITPPKGKWSIKERVMPIEDVARGDVFETSVPLVGDIDGDGIIEIVCAGRATSPMGAISGTIFSCDSIKVFDALNQRIKKRFKVERFHGGFGTIAMADVDKDGFAEIFVATDGNATSGNRGYIYCYSHTGTFKWRSLDPYVIAANLGTHAFPYLNIVDFNGDGIPEIMANDRIFNAQNGKLLLDCNLIATGKDYGTGAGHAALDIAGNSLGAFSATGDIDGDGLPELIAGRNIYKITIDATNVANNACDPLRSVIPGTHIGLGDGYTTVADIDLDGTLDVVVVRLAPSKTQQYLFVWSGKTGALLHTNEILTSSLGGLGWGGSIPLVGDLDGDGVPEIAFTGFLRLHAYKYDKVAQTLNPLWTTPFTTSDQSAATSMSLFDFDQDGATELVYRDQDSLRIIDGKTKAIKAKFDCHSWTLNEYPVIADVTGDGRANIVVMGKPKNHKSNGNGYLYVFEADLETGTPWAPARSVWNQWAYNAVNVNEDLTIPKYQFSTTTVFPGKDGILGTLDDVRPYNGFLMQQTRLDINGTPLFTAPNAEIRKQPSFVYNVAKDSMTVSITVHNAGDAAFQNPFKITAYKNDVSNTPKLTHSYAEVINAGDSAVITFGIPKFKAEWTQPTFTGLFFRMNDKGNGYADQAVCDSSKRDFKTGLVIASDDRALVFVNSVHKIEILKNDIYPATCGIPTIGNPLVQNPKYGSLAIVAGVINYTPNTDYIGPDTIRYKITCGTESSEAMVVINVVPQPDNISGADCFVEPSKGDWKIQEIANLGDVSTYMPNLVGDLDGDGKPEIVSVSKHGTTLDALITVFHKAQYISVFKGTDRSRIEFATHKSFNPIMTGAIAIARIKGKGMIIVAEADNYIRAYDMNGNFLWTTYADGRSGDKWASEAVNTNIAETSLGFADFNNDGKVEIYAGNKIFDAETGIFLCGGTENEGRSVDPNSGTGNAAHFMTFAANVYGDARLELVAGNQVYEIMQDLTSMSVVKKVTVPICIEKPEYTILDDGLSQVVDIDNDGKLEVIVQRRIAANVNFLYIWSPEKQQVLAQKTFLVNTVGIPFIGDIDGDGVPEILLIAGGTAATNMIYAFKYVPGNSLLQEFWHLPHNDNSSMTGLVLFDFNQDKISEIVYRDEVNLRIINGSKKSHKTGNDTIVYNLSEFNCSSGTGYEYPVIADIDNDGEAEIVVAGPATGAPVNGPLRIFKAGAGTKWAPARKVWNQYAYNAVNVNNDLTIPKYQLNPATVFPGKDGVLGTADDVRPYNGFLMQQTTLNSHGTSLFLAPNAEIRKQPSFVYDALRDSMTVSVTIHNAGDAAFNNPFKITAYKNAVGGTPKYTYTYAGVINAGDSAVITFGIPKFKAEWMQTPFSGLVIQANDKGDGANDQVVCKDNKRSFSTGSIIASDDRALVFVNSVHKIEILKNDIYPTTCGIPAIGDPLVQNPKHGSVAIVAGVINYTPTTDYIGPDTIRYKITCGTESSEAMVVINVVPQPDNISGAECYTDIKEFEFKFDPNPTKISNTLIDYSPAFAGDLDNDGIPELVSVGTWDGNNWQGQRVHIFSGKNRNESWITLPGGVKIALAGGSIALGRIKYSTDVDTSLIFIAGLDSYLYAYSMVNLTTPIWKSDSKFTNTMPHTALSAQTIGIADFNNDGYAELYINNSVFDATTGKFICRAPTAKNEGFSNAHTGNSMSVTIAGDIDNDRKLELMAGNMVWKVSINRISDSNITGSMSEFAKITLPTQLVGAEDGHTQLTDLNDDGKLDIVVSKVINGGALTAIYVWNPISKQIIASTICNSGANVGPGWYQGYGKGFPMIGDIDGDKVPEIILLVDKIRAFKYDGTDQLKQFWELAHTDVSYGTGMTLFDFNNDGKYEIVYRDVSNLRIIDGSTKVPVNLVQIACTSSTLTEYPLILDVDNDGAAEIVVTGNSATSTSSLLIFKSGGTKWAPARKVWNQYSYNAVNINEDLTIPKYQLNPATVFPGKDGVLGTVDDVRPYNAFLQQQTLLNKDGNPLWPVPDFQATPTWSINTTASTATISFCVKNTGDASGNSPLYVSVYKGSHSGTAIITKQYTEVPAIGDTKCYTLEIQNPSSYQTDQLIVVINDKGDGTWQQPECNYDNNNLEINLEGLPIARPDYISVMACDSVQFDYLTNDYRPTGTIVTNATKAPKLGTFTTVGTDGKYTDTPPCNPRQLDTIGYKLCNGGLCSEANIVVSIRTRPQITLQDSCSLQPRLVVDYQYQDMTYKWEYSEDNATWITETSSTTTFLNVNKSGWYRVKLTQGTEVLVSAVYFEVIKKSMLAGDLIWYESGLR